MQLLEDALDDYLHMLVRTHPWDKKRYEAALTPLFAWLAQAGSDTPQAALTDASLARYLGTLSGPAHVDAEAAARDFYTWAIAWGWLAPAAA